jgi:ABC-type transporter Mla subunit MlaD
VAERFPIEIEFKGIDDVSDEIKTVQEGLKGVAQTSEMTAERAKQVLKEAREQKQILKALAEQSDVFGKKAEFIANEFNKIAGFGAKLNNIYDSINTAMTRINTAQTNLNLAKQHEAELLARINAEYEKNFTTIDEAINYLQQLQAEIEAMGGKAQMEKQLIKELTAVKKDLTNATKEVATAQQQWQQQMIALSLQAVGLIPSFFQMVNSISHIVALAPQVGTALNAVKMGFMALYGAMGPVGLALIGIGTAVALLITYWDQIAPILQRVAATIMGFLGPALEWIWNNILVPLGQFIAGIFVSNLKTFKAAWDMIIAVANEVGKALQWVWDNILMPLGEFIISIFIGYIRSWVAAFEWARDMIIGVFNKIYNVVMGVLDAIKSAIDSFVSSIRGAFDWLYRQLVGGSIVPDMWEGIREWTAWGVRETAKLMDQLGMLGEGPTVRGPVSVSVTINAAGVSDPEQLAGIVSRELVRRLRAM